MDTNNTPVNRPLDYVDPIQENSTDIGNLLDQLDHVFNDTSIHRRKLLQKMEDAVEIMQIKQSDDLDTVTQKIMIVKQTSDLIDGIEKSFTTRVNTRLKRKELDTSASLAQAAVELLQRIDSTKHMSISGSINIDEELKKIENRVADQELTATEDECKTSHQDI